MDTICLETVTRLICIWRHFRWFCYVTCGNINCNPWYQILHLHYHACLFFTQFLLYLKGLRRSFAYHQIWQRSSISIQSVKLMLIAIIITISLDSNEANLHSTKYANTQILVVVRADLQTKITVIFCKKIWKIAVSISHVLLLLTLIISGDNSGPSAFIFGC